jgi:hypothetical protein
VTEFVVKAVREVLSDGEFHTFRDISEQVELRIGPRDWRELHEATKEVGVLGGFVMRHRP